MRQVTWL